MINETYTYNKNLCLREGMIVKMKKFTKKRVFIIFFSIIIGLAVYIGQNTQSNGRNERSIGDAIQVTALPVSGKVVILDAGHGTPDEGVSLLH